MYLSNTIVDKPKGVKLCPSGKSVYVYHVLESTYDSKKQYNTDKRISIGKMVEGSKTKMIPNDRFRIYYPELLAAVTVLPEPPAFSHTLHIGAVAVERKLADDLGITKILIDIYGEPLTSEILSVIAYVLTEESAVFQHYPAFMRCHLPYSLQIRSDSYISSKLLHQEITDERISEMLRQWNQLHHEIGKIYVGCDSTNFNTEAEVSLAEFGAAKDDPTKPQVNLAVAISQDDNTPLYYDLFPGSIIDLTECEQLIDQLDTFGYKGIGLLFDRGYFSEPNVRKLDELGYDFMMMLREDQIFVKNLILDHAGEVMDNANAYLGGMETYGITVESTLFDKTRHFHIYYDDLKASYAKRRFLNSISLMKDELSGLKGTKLRKNTNIRKYKSWFELDIDKTSRELKSFALKDMKANERLLFFGFFVIMTSESMEPEKALGIYRGRDNIEKFFRGIKSGLDFDSPGVHDDISFSAKIHLMFIAGIIRNSLSRASADIKKKTGNKKAYTVPMIIDQLEQIECTAFDDKQYMRRYALTAKQKLILDSLSIDHEVIDNEIAKVNALHLLG